MLPDDEFLRAFFGLTLANSWARRAKRSRQSLSHSSEIQKRKACCSAIALRGRRTAGWNETTNKRRELGGRALATARCATGYQG